MERLGEIGGGSGCPPRRPQDGAGFTLVELLVAVVIISALAAIAVPALFGQRDKALDAEAKAYLATAQRAIETRAADSGGSYAGADAATLEAVEPTLAGAALAVVDAGADRYELRVLSDSTTAFTLVRNDDGTLARSCAPAAAGGCTADGTW